MHKQQKIILVLIFILLITKTSFCLEQKILYSEGFNGAVSSSHPLASKVAIDILKEGGNAIDAAVAASFVLGVVDFSNSGIGGEAFALIHFPTNKIIAIDGSTKRPHNNIKYEYKSKISLPTIPEMLLKMLRLYGTKQPSTILKPAIDFCYKGFEITPYLSSIISNSIKNEKICKSAFNLFYKNKKPIQQGEILIQPILGDTLTRLSKDNGLSFYYGNDADIILSDMNKKEALYSKYDFMKYKSSFVKPIKLTYDNFNIYGNPLPSSSIATIKLTKKLLDSNQDLINLDINDITHQSQICRQLLNEKYSILANYYNKTTDFFYSTKKDKFSSRNTELDDSNTTHLCVWDKNNMIVSITLTLGNHFGSGELSPLGFFYANSLNNYSNKIINYPSDYPNNAGPLTSKSPIIVTIEGKPFLALGGAGANRIITNTAYMLARIIKGYDLNKSMKEPRFYLDLNNSLYIEKSANHRIADNQQLNNNPKNYKVIYKPYLSDYFGLISAIVKDYDFNILKAVGDMHRDGSCLTY